LGNIGLGKSTFARKLADKGAIVVNLDSIVTMVHGGDYKGYREDWKELYKVFQSAIITTAIKNDKKIIAIDDTNMKRSRRKKLISLGTYWQLRIFCYDFGRGTEEGSKRRMKEPKGYERPKLEEGFDEIISMRGQDARAYI